MSKPFNRILTALVLMALMACSTVTDVLNDNTLFAGIAAYKATSRIIERSDEPQARAQRIITYTEAATRLVDSDTPVTLEQLYQHVHVLVMSQVPSIDRQPAEDMLDALRDQLAQEIDEFVTLTPETEVSLLHVISRIRSAAEHYA